MGAHSTLDVRRADAVEKLASVDWDDVPTKKLETVLDALLYDTLYNFTVMEDDWHVDERLISGLSGLEIPSTGKKESEAFFWTLSESNQETFKDLESKGFGIQEIRTLIESRNENY